MKENRFYEVRAAEATSGIMSLTDRAVVFDQPTMIHDPLGDYTEIIRAGALASADLSDRAPSHQKSCPPNLRDSFS